MNCSTYWYSPPVQVYCQHSYTGSTSYSDCQYPALQKRIRQTRSAKIQSFFSRALLHTGTCISQNPGGTLSQYKYTASLHNNYTASMQYIYTGSKTGSTSYCASIVVRTHSPIVPKMTQNDNLLGKKIVPTSMPVSFPAFSTFFSTKSRRHTVSQGHAPWWPSPAQLPGTFWYHVWRTAWESKDPSSFNSPQRQFRLATRSTWYLVTCMSLSESGEHARTSKGGRSCCMESYQTPICPKI